MTVKFHNNASDAVATSSHLVDDGNRLNPVCRQQHTVYTTRSTPTLNGNRVVPRVPTAGSNSPPSAGDDGGQRPHLQQQQQPSANYNHGQASSSSSPPSRFYSEQPQATSFFRRNKKTAFIGMFEGRRPRSGPFLQRSYTLGMRFSSVNAYERSRSNQVDAF